MALSKIYQQRLEQLHEDVDRSLIKKIKCGLTLQQYKSLDDIELGIESRYFVEANQEYRDNITIEYKIELLTKLEEL